MSECNINSIYLIESVSYKRFFATQTSVIKSNSITYKKS